MIFIEGRFVAGGDADTTAYETGVTYNDAKRSMVITAIEIGTSSRELKLLGLINCLFSLHHLAYKDDRLEFRII